MLRPGSLGIPRRQYIMLMGGLFAGCMDRVVKLEGRLDGIEGHAKEQDEELKRLADENKRQWAKMNCNSEDVRDFLKACEQGNGEQCSQTAIDGSMAFLNSQDYVTIYLRYDQRAYMMTQLRRGLLIKQIRRNYLFPTTRFLIIVQPRGEDQAKQEEARRIGEDLSQYLRFDLHLPADRPVLGPHILPCRTKRNWISHYGDRYDQPQPGEPQKKEDRVRIWCFRTDC